MNEAEIDLAAIDEMKLSSVLIRRKSSDDVHTAPYLNERPVEHPVVLPVGKNLHRNGIAGSRNRIP